MRKKRKKTSVVGTLFSWEAAARPYKKRDKTFFQTASALAFLLVVIALFIKEWLLVAVVLAVVFVSYVLAAVPPPIIGYKITRKGVWVSDSFYPFTPLTEYWFEKHLESYVLVFYIVSKRPQRVSVVIPDSDQEKIKEELAQFLVFRERPLKTAVDKIADWTRKNIPLEEQ